MALLYEAYDDFPQLKRQLRAFDLRLWSAPMSPEAVPSSIFTDYDAGNEDQREIVDAIKTHEPVQRMLAIINRRLTDANPTGAAERVIRLFKTGRQSNQVMAQFLSQFE